MYVAPPQKCLDLSNGVRRSSLSGTSAQTSTLPLISLFWTSDDSISDFKVIAFLLHLWHCTFLIFYLIFSSKIERLLNRMQIYMCILFSPTTAPNLIKFFQHRNGITNYQCSELHWSRIIDYSTEAASIHI